MIHKKLFKSIVIISVGLLLFTGCGRKEDSVISEAVEMQEPEEPEIPEPEPVVEPEPEPEPEPVQEEVIEEEVEPDLGYEIIPMDATTYYATQSANLRNGPGTQYEKVGSLSYAQEIICSGYVEDGEKLWLVLKSDTNDIQMVSASLVSQTKPIQKSPTTPNGNGNGNGGSSQSQQPTGGGGSASTDSEEAIPGSTNNPWGLPAGDGSGFVGGNESGWNWE